ncbi:MAG: DUF3179 domain-containing protein [Nitrospiraceae bacterium]|nr:MAG: DUF3179 domain-containing protein [Nitrospiraceae bacterium]
MAMVKSMILAAVLIMSFTGCTKQDAPSAPVVREGGKTYIVDKTGYKWDVTQAGSIGFKPDKFQYGIGKDAILPLDASGLSDDKKDVPDDLRVIGVEEGASAQAYSVQKLRSHEVANSAIGSKPIAVGY